MSLSASQQQTLATMETGLHAQDPGLAAEFAAFSGGLQCPAGPWALGAPKGRHRERDRGAVFRRWLRRPGR